LTRQPDSIPGRLSLARLLLEQGAFDKALAEADRIEECLPGSLEVLELKAQILLLRRSRQPASGARDGEDVAGERVAAPDLASPTLAALYAAQGHAGRPASRSALLPESPGASPPVERLEAFREAARRRREELRR
jgi:hypothetical protein